MEITCRKYKDKSDYKRICEFLKETYLSYGTRFYDNITLFEFQCALSSGQQDGLKEVDEVLNETFLWFDGDKLIGKLTEDSFCIRGEYRQIFNDIVEIREKLCLRSEDDIEWEIFEGDKDFEDVLTNRGYHKTEEYWVIRDIECSKIGNIAKLPYGFSVKFIQDVEDYERVYKAYELCYGILFNESMLNNFYKTSTYRKELDVVIVGPDNEVVALCSGRYDETNKMASVEAVSCYKEYRNKGISKAMLLYILNEAKKLGAEKVTVLTSMPERHIAPNRLYESVGFNIVGKSYVWKKEKWL